jgi:hypothetical protein
MENNFGLILLDLVRKNKDKFLGLLRRNGVLVNTNTSNEDLTNMILKAMQKSESFKKETILLMGVIMGNSDGSFSNVTGSSYFSNLPTFDANAFSPSTTTNATTTTTDKPKKDFADTTVGTIFDKLFTIGNAYLTNKELDVRKVEATEATEQKEKELEIKKEEDKDKSNVGLYIGLGVGGLAIVGVLIYLIAKKK